MPTLLDDRPTTKTKRFWLPSLSLNPDTRSVQVGLIWTILVHLLLLLLAPRILRTEYVPGRPIQPDSNAQNFEIQLTPLPPEQTASPPRPMRFVETNPDANNNVPDNTENFGAQNQQAAQPVPDKNSTLRMPKTEGKKDFQNDSQVVTGRLQKPDVTPPAPPAQEQQNRHRPERHPPQTAGAAARLRQVLR